MIKIMRQGMNPILNQYDYLEMGVCVGIDVGENIVVQYGLDTRTYTIENKQILKKPHLDILGYTISIAVKMTAFTKSDQIIIGQLVYDRLDAIQKYAFRVLPVSSDVWSYVSNNTGYVFTVYMAV
jgi:adenylate cyclase